MRNSKCKILVVDDQHAIVSARTAILKSRNFETASAFSGEEAVQVAHAFQPDCIVSDITMGAMNGVEAAIEILGVLPRCKIFFISGNVNNWDVIEKARARGFDFEVLQKPVPPPVMLARVEQFCSQCH